MINRYPSIVHVTDFGIEIGPIPYDLGHPKDINARGLRHSTSNTFIFEDYSQSKLLLTRRSERVSHGGVLNVTVGGHAKWLENENRAQTPLETALSELEEVFYQQPVPKELSLKPVSQFRKDIRPNDPEYVHLFEGIYKGLFSLQPDEVSEAFFEDLDLISREVLRNPEKYVRSARFYLERLQENIK